MPPRTNAKQAAITVIQRELAASGLMVSESKTLRSVRGVEREVDVVVEGMFHGVPVVMSFEVTATRRKVDLPWVEARIRNTLSCRRRF